ncbi:gliding motility-associated C-terminal domain-containing protein [Flavobacterium faecale]|nr:gliding motility-associated C-terminal domain-containing protein [Flavobacterium faecale]
MQSQIGSAVTITAVATNNSVQCSSGGHQTALNSWLNSHGNSSAITTCTTGQIKWTNNYSSSSFVKTCGNAGKATVVFTAKDDCGNSKTTTANFTVNDDTYPVFTNYPNGTTANQQTCGSVQNLKFSSFTEVSGDGNANTFLKGEVFKFPNVTTNVYALVTIKDLLNASIPLLDDNTPGLGTDGFKPQTKFNLSATGEQAWVEYNVAFYDSTTNQPVILPTFYANFSDIDGNSNFGEQNWTEQTADYITDSPTELTITNPSPWIVATSGTNEYTGVSNAYPQVNISTRYEQRSMLSFRVGVISRNGTQSGNLRQHSVDFDCQPSSNYGVPSTIIDEITLECDQVKEPETLTATDNCGKATVNFTETRKDGSCANKYTLTRTWTATDECGKSVKRILTINVQDTKAPVLSAAPAAVTVECSAVPTAATLTATDNCDASPVVTYKEVKTDGACANAYTLTRTWTATDACGNASSKTQVITVQDKTAPVLSTAPTAVTVECSAIPTAATLTATDNCDTSPVVTYKEVKTDGACANAYTLTRTWTATDACGNASSKTQVITVQDKTAPVLSTAPTAVTVECSAIPTAATLTATDNCDASPVVTYKEVKNDGACANAYTLTRTWTATDACGNASSKTQVITVQDKTAPVLSTAPAAVTVECSAIPTAATLTATDNCDASPVVTYKEVKTNGACANAYTLTRTWTATDACGNASSKTQVITVQDKTAPVLSTAPAAVTVECSAIPTAATLTATDNCDTSPVVTYKEVKTDGACANAYTLTRTWTATDACGNASSKSQIITVQDKTAPVLSAAPTAVTVECSAIPTAATLTATDNCDASPVVTYKEVKTDGACANAYTLTRTWTATDACGNASSKTQVITVQDKTAPVLSTAPTAVTVECSAIPTAATLTATDNCDTSPVVTYKEVKTDGACANAYTLTRTWTATDACGNASSKTQVITVQDKTAPVLSTAPTAVTVECSAIPTAATLTATDNCDASPVVTYKEVKNDGACANAYTLTRTWTATDACGNASSKTQVITVQDKTAPVLSTAPAAVTVECSAIPTAATLTATDNCDASPVVTYKEVKTNGACANAYTLTRTWTATDACGNASSKTQVITVQDKTAPVLSTAPAAVTVECSAIPTAATLTATDNCDASPVVTYKEVKTDGACANAYTLTRTWTATDACGNASSKTQVITVQDKTAPVLSTAPTAVTVECSAIPTAATLTATDNCDASPVVTYKEVKTNGACPNAYTLTRTWTATDACGNASSKTQVITVQDKTAPVLSTAPTAVTVECSAIPTAATLTATDNCDTSPVVTYKEVKTDGACANAYTLTRTWTATDACGNASSKTQVITVQDKTAPVLSTAPTAVTVECSAIPTAATLTATDNCDASPVVTYKEVKNDGACANAYTLTRTWTATDACGNASSKTQVITVQDTKAPVFENLPATTTISYNSTPTFQQAVATDNCSAVTLTFKDEATTPDCNGSYSTTRTWTAKDVCLNTSTASQTINVKSAVVLATNDAGNPVNGFVGGTSYTNVLSNDKFEGQTATTSQVKLTLVSSTNTGVSLSGTNVVVAAGTPSGSYTLTYQICGISATCACSTATVTVPVTAAPIDAVDDTFASTNGLAGNTNAGNVLNSNPSSANTPDTLNGAQASVSNVKITVVTPATPLTPGAKVPAIDPATGIVSIPAGTPAGTYTIKYKICEILNSANCDEATVTVPVTAAPIDAVDDTFASTNGLAGNTNAGNVLNSNASSANTPDTLNGAQATVSNVKITVVTPATPLTPGAKVPAIDPATGIVSIPAGTPAGTYTIKYKICEILNPTNCDEATISVPVSAAAIDAIDDVIPSTNGLAGNTNAGNVLTNNPTSPDTLNGAQASVSNVKITVTTPATPLTPGAKVPTIDPATGIVSIPAGTPAGTYTIKYKICEILNPTNCDEATISVPVSAAAIDAIDDVIPSTNGLAGNTNAGNVLTNNPTSPDTLNGAQATVSNVKITVTTPATPLTPGAKVPAIDPATGIVSIPAGTPAGTYTIKYKICEILNSANCDEATVTVPVTAAPIDAVDDIFASTNGLAGNTNAGNVLNSNPSSANTPDTLNGAQASVSNVKITVTTPATPLTTGAKVPAIDPATGIVSIPAGTPAGSYTIKYQICEILNSANCDEATVTVPVTAAPIDAVDDTFASTNGLAGNTNAGNVLNSNASSANTPDTLNGAQATVSNVKITVVTPATPLTPGAKVPAIDPATGIVSIPAGTPAGTYTIKYKICEILNPTNCDEATISVPVSAAAIDAIDDVIPSTNGLAGNTNAGNVLTNNPTSPDTLNGAQATVSNVKITVTTPATPLTPGAKVPAIDPATGIVSIPAGTPAGTYTIKYKICEILNSANCDEATVTVPVTAAPIDAVDDTFASTNGLAGNTNAGNVLNSNPSSANTPDTLNGAQATVSNVKITVTTPATPLTPGAKVPAIDPATGIVSIPAGTPAGTYTIKYKICEILNSANCDEATVTVPVTAAPIDAVDDTFASTNGLAGNTNAGNVLNSNPSSANTPDTLNGAQASVSNVKITVVTPATPLTTGAKVPAIDPATGIVSIPAGTPAGSYTIKYKICEILNSANCDEATVTVPVTAAPIDAVDDTFASTNGLAGNTNAGNVLNSNPSSANTPDTLNGAQATVSNVKITVTTPATPLTPGAKVPAIDPATGIVSIPAGTPAGTYTIKYKICEILNSANCDEATVTVPVTAAPIDAVDDTFASTNGLAGNTNAGNVLNSNPSSANTPDTLNGAQATVSNVKITVTTPAAPLTTGAKVPAVDPATGIVSIPAGTPAGSYTIKYKICEILNSANCDEATVTVPVTAAPIDAVDDIFASTNGLAGNTNAGNVLNSNPSSANTPDTLNGAQASVSNVKITVVTPATPLTTGAKVPAIDPATGIVSIPAGTPAGSYTIKYKICEILNSANCDEATVTVPVTAAPIDAVDDTFASTNGLAGNTNAGNVLNSNPSSANTPDTLNGAQASVSNVKITVTTPATPLTPGAKVPAIDPATGIVSIPAGTPAGTYTIKYKICEILNSANCDEATVTVPVTAAPIDAVDDTFASTNGLAGNTNAGNVLNSNPSSANTPDTLNGAQASVSNVKITVTTPATPLTTGAKVPAIDPATGIVSIPAGTPAGSYTIKYQICEILNSANCDEATVTVPVTAAPIDAVDDTFASTNGLAGNTNAGNVLNSNPSSANTPDTLNGAQASVSNVKITVTTPAAPLTTGAKVPAIDPATGIVSIPAGTPAGSYTIKYKICEILNSANCDEATVTVPVTAAPIDAVDDIFASTNGLAGNTNAGNVLNSNPSSANTPDTLNGAQASVSNVKITVTTPATPLTTGAKVPAIDPATGIVSIPAGTPAGTYTIKYKICEILNSANCDEATVTVPVTAAPIDAVDDTFASTNGLAGNTNAGNVLNSNPSSANTPDTLNGAQASVSNVKITVTTPATPLTPGAKVPAIDPATGIVSIPAGTPAGSYTIKYKICEILNSANCDEATVTVPVTAAPIDAVDDTFASTNGLAGNTNAGNVLNSNPSSANTPDTLNGAQASVSNVKITVTTPATPLTTGAKVPAIDPATGIVSIPAGTPAGSYTIKYQICEILNSANCDEATVTVPVTAAPIDAVDDTFASTNGLAGNTNAGNVLNSNPSSANTPDTLNGAQASVSNVKITVTTPAAPLTTGAKVPAIDPATGIVSIPAGTPAGSYTIKYKICEILNSANCDEATVTVPVTAAPIDAVDDIFASTNGLAGNTNAGNVLNSNPSSANTPDTLNGAQTTVSNVKITVVTPATPKTTGAPVPSVDPTTGVVSIPAGTPAGSYTIKYQICEILNPTNCSDAIVTVPVSAASIVAVNDAISTTNGLAGNTNAGNVLTNNPTSPDTLNGAQATVSNVEITVTAAATPKVNGAPVPTVDPATGIVTIPAGTPAGSYTIDYKICEILNPDNCSDATVTIPVSAATILAVDDAIPTTNGLVGNTNAGNVLTNNPTSPDTLNGAQATVSNVEITVIKEATPKVDGAPVPTVDPATGIVTIPAGTPAGSYTIDYKICEILNPDNCSDATVTIPVSAATILAVDDAIPTTNGLVGNTNAGNVLTNNPISPDTLNGAQATVSNVEITVTAAATPKVDGAPVPTVDPATGIVTIPAGTPAGSYTIDYKICEILNPDNCSDATVTIPVYTPSISVTKDGTFVDSNSNGKTNVGDEIRYTFVVKNNGSAPLTNVTITDNNATVSGGPIAILDINESDSSTFSGIHIITQEDINAGIVYNLATATGTPPVGEPVTATSTDPTPCTTCTPDPTCPTCTISEVPQNPSISITKDGTYVDVNKDGKSNVGDTVTYTFVVTNTGNVPLTNVTVTDNNATVTGGPIAILDVNATDSTTFTATHILTQADINAGIVYNLATATGKDPKDKPVTATSTDPTPCTTCTPDPTCPTCTISEVPQNPSISITKDGTYVDVNKDGKSNVGDTVTYTFVLKNTGNVTLTNVTVTDDNATVTGGPIAILDVNATDSTTFTATHILTQADINAGIVYNLATATGKDPKDKPVTATSTDPTPCTTCTPDPTCPTCTISEVPQNPSISITKDGTYVDVNKDGKSNVGDTVTYTFVLKNTGNVTLTNVTVTDDNATVTGGPIAILDVNATDSTTFTATHILTQADINAGIVYNLATATGKDPKDKPVTATTTDPTPCTTCTPDPTCPTCTISEVPQNPSISITKDGTYVDVNKDGKSNVGDTVTYTFVLKNTGNVTLTNVTVTDDNATVTGGPIAILDVNATDSTTFTATHILTQADINAGIVFNLATATGKDPKDKPVTATSTDPTPCTTCTPDPTCPTCTITEVPQNPSISITKDGTYVDVNKDGKSNVGDTVTYTFVVTNTGNVTLTNVTVTDDNATVTGGPIAILDVNTTDSTTFTATHILTQADINAGIVYNLATATGKDPKDKPVTATSTDPTPCTTCTPDPTCPTCTITEVPQNPSISLVKTGLFNDTNKDGYAQVGEKIDYTFTVTNTGNVTITNIIVTDPMIATITGNPVTTLAPGATVATIKGTYTLTQADIDAGKVFNTALAKGQDPKGNNVQDISGTTVTNDTKTETALPSRGALALVKTGTFVDTNKDGFAQVGETIEYSFVVTNTGSVTVTNIVVTDPLIPTITGGPIATLAPGATFTALKGTYVLTQADIDTGKVINTALAKGQDPKGNNVQDISGTAVENDTKTETPLAQTGSLSVVKTAVFMDDNNDGFAQAGEIIRYNFAIKNTGNITLFNVTLTDLLPGLNLSGSPIPVLAIGEMNSVAYTATYPLTQADITLGTVSNQATVIGKTRFGQDITAVSTASSDVKEEPTVLGVVGCVVEPLKAVSPNNDGDNDVFYVRGIECYPDNTVEIYNRWGVLVFERNNYNNADRAFKGISEGRVTISQATELPTGTYYYIVNYKDTDSVLQQKAGYLYLNR